MSAALSVELQRLDGAEDLPLPEYQSEGAAGMDLAAALAGEEKISLNPGARALVPTGFAIGLPAGFEAQVRPRSGLAVKNGVTVLNSPGTIDSDYRGEIKVLLINLGTETFHIERGMRIAQLVIMPVTQASWTEMEILSPTTRASGGFGSTGA